ncbi:MAG: sensor histidine kinase [Egibacteraceae bacterium]
MLRRSLLFVPVAMALAALLGGAMADDIRVAVVIAAILGLSLAGGLARAADLRVSRAAERVLGFSAGESGGRVELGGSQQWRRLGAALSAVGESLQERFGELAEERARVERLLDTLPTAVLLFTPVGLAYANPAAQERFGVGRREDRTPLQVLGAEGLADAVVEARETGRPVTVGVRRDDRELEASASVTAEGEVALVVSDLTESRRLDAVRRDFVTNASHELKTPVAGMQALADSLSLAIDRDPERARQMIGRLQSEALRLARLVRDLLDLARLEDSTAETQRRRVDLAEIVRGQVDRLAPLARERGVTLRVDDGRQAPLVAVPGDLRLLAANLMENAIRYNRPGGTVHVSVRRGGGRVVLEVGDTGIGIPEAEQDRVFERFYRVDKGRSRAQGGTGLGLAIVRHAAERHGGQVSLRSVLGEGSVFRVTLPVEGSDPGTS